MAMPFLAKEGKGGELLLSPLVIRPPEATDGMLQGKGAALVADDGAIDGDFTDDVYLKRTHMMARKQTETGAVPAPITLTSKAVQTHKAVEMDGSLLHFKGEKGFRAEEDHDVTVTHARVKGGMSTITAYTSVPNRYKATDDVVFDTPEGSISLQHLVVDARKLIARAPKGQVSFLLGTNHSQTVTHTKKSTGLHTSVRQTVETSKTHVASSIQADIEVVTADTQRVMIQEIAGHATGLLDRMVINGVPATVEMINREVCNDVHTLESHKSRSLTPICGAVIALAVTLATNGVGSMLLGAKAAMAVAVSNAAFSTLCAHAATSWANHDGNIGRASQDLARDKTLKAIALSAATAGATAGLGEAMGLPTDANTWNLRMARGVVNTAATTAVHGVFGEDMADAAKAGIRTGMATVVQGTLAHKIGDSKPNVVTGLGLHAAAGGLSGAILGGRDGILPGAVAAMVGEGVAEGTGKATFGKFMGAVSGAAIDIAQGRDGTKGLAVGTFTATTAVENNFLRHTVIVAKATYQLVKSKMSRKALEKAVQKLPKRLKDYVREVESKSGTKVHPEQRELLAKDLRENGYRKLTPEEKIAHSKQFDKVRPRLIDQWEKMGGTTKVREWPRYQALDKRTGQMELKRYQAHHINPQQLGGKHEWWNMHPVHPTSHQGGIHGSGSVLNSILKGLK